MPRDGIAPRVRDDITKLIEAGLLRNPDQARAFAADLGAACGDAVLARRIERTLTKMAPGPLTPLPLDQDTRLNLLQVFAADDVPPPVFLPDRAEEAVEHLLACCERADALEAAGLPAPRAALLHGPTGTGKTATARLIAQRLGRALAVVRLDGMISSHMGQTGANLSRAFRWATEHRCVLLLDEIDAIARTRGSEDGSAAAGETWRVVTALLQLLDAHDGLLLAATNRLDALDPALLRRFEFRVEVAAPDAAARACMVRLWMAALCPEDIGAMVAATDGWSGAEIRSACLHAARMACVAGRAAVSDRDWADAEEFLDGVAGRRVRPGPLAAQALRKRRMSDGGRGARVASQGG